MNDRKLIRLLKRSDEKALEFVIQTYTAYVSTVITNQLGGFCDISAIEELTSDVFFSLWQNRAELNTFQLRGWLGATARNKAKNHLRAQKYAYEELNEDCIICSDDNVFDNLEQNEQHKIISSALHKLKPEESDILIRYYFYNQTVRQISDETVTNIETVKSRLARGRKKLKSILDKGGYFK